jgi:hypothetical protein
MEVDSLRTKQNGERGFVFSLDGCLALVIIMIVVAGVASAGESGLSYGQHGYLTLQRYANDALETMSLTGSMDNLADLVIKGNLDQAKALVRQELGKVLPGDVQFKLVIGQESNPDLVVYPSDKTNWDNAFKNAGETAVAARVISRRPITQHILAWLDDPLDEAFMDEVVKGTNWDVTAVNKDEDFQKRIVQQSPSGGLYYDVIFVPDDNTEVWSQTTKQNLIAYNASKGRLVFGGMTLFMNENIKNPTPYDLPLLKIFGVDQWGSVIAGPPQFAKTPIIKGQPEFNKMLITDISEEITLPPPFSVGYTVQYSGQKYEQYLYIPRTTGPISAPKVVANWENVPAGWQINPTPWLAIIWLGGIPGYFHQTVLFNMRLAQSAMDNTTNPPNAGKDDWVLLARRAIGIYVSDFKPATLYVWRGGAV